MDSLGDLWEIVADYVPSRQKGFRAIPLYLLALILVSLVTVFIISLSLVVGPVSSIIKAIKHPEKVDDSLKFDKELHAPEPIKPKKTPEEIAEENRIWHEKIRTTRFRVDRKDIPFDPEENEVFFFTPERAEDVENAISSHYYEIKNAFEQRYLSFVFLPFFNKELNVMLSADKVSYYSPHAAHLLRIPN